MTCAAVVVASQEKGKEKKKTHKDGQLFSKYHCINPQIEEF
jgi:hypothetical protein